MWRALSAPVFVDEFQIHLGRAGFNVRKMTEVGTVKMTKLDWYDRLRIRGSSAPSMNFLTSKLKKGLWN
jgi:hypothetical protein